MTRCSSTEQRGRFLPGPKGPVPPPVYRGREEELTSAPPTDRGVCGPGLSGPRTHWPERASDQGSCRSLAWRLAPSKGVHYVIRPRRAPLLVFLPNFFSALAKPQVNTTLFLPRSLWGS